MKIGSIHTIQAIAQFLGRDFKGDSKFVITGINTFNSAENGDLTCVEKPKYTDVILSEKELVFIVDEDLNNQQFTNYIISPHPFLDFNRLLLHFSPLVIHKNMTGERCSIADSAHLSPNCFIGNDVFIGEKVIIHPGAYIGDGTILENEVVIGPNTIIGCSSSETFSHNKIIQRLHTCGSVHIEKNTTIGAGCIIESGTTNETRIAANTIIGNQVFIGHDVFVEQFAQIHASSKLFLND